MTYSVKEIFKTLQGEGAQTGRAAAFCRFAGCNLWSGREEDREKAACRFCDTDFVGTDGGNGGKFTTADALADAVAAVWGPGAAGRYVVLTGGEPLLQLDPPLIDALHTRGFEIAVETNGTAAAPPGIDWLCVSPKAGTDWIQRAGDELKLVWRQDGLGPEGLSALPFKHFFLQPMDGPDRAAHLAAAADHCRENPPWRLSLQTHKLIGIP